VRDACSDNHKSSTSAVNLHSPKVDIQELREAERLFHQSQAVIERVQNDQRQRVYATSVRRILPQPIRRVTDSFRDKYRSSHSRPR